MNDGKKVFSKDEYEKTYLNIDLLRQLMPENSFAVLAREVLTRVATHPSLENVEVTLQPCKETVDDLATALISPDKNTAANFVLGLRAEGLSAETVYLSYLAHAARRLGEWWEEDRVSLIDVTIGTGQIYSLMRAMAPLFSPSQVLIRKAAVFSTVPGDSHTLGVRMAADLFRRNGWDIDLLVDLSVPEIVHQVRSSGHHLIGLSGGGQHAIAELVRLIVALRIQNPSCLIFVSGNIVNEAEEAVSLSGADAYSTDFKDAEAKMDLLWETHQTLG